MTLESYKNFVTIVECGSILAAANKLLIAQPSLSNQLKNIEKNYGTTPPPVIGFCGRLCHNIL